MAGKDRLSEQEQAVLDRIVADPFAGQQEIADRLGLARPTVASYIAQLTRKGYLLGRAYVFAQADRIVCIGGATVDRKYRARQALQYGTSNPVTSRRGFGGVARNVAETLARLGVSSALVSVVGDDENGRSLVRHLQSSGVDTARLLVCGSHATAEYVAILDADHELALGIADMEILETMSADDLQLAWPALAGASWVFADCNLPAPVLDWLRARRLASQFRLAIDAVSTRKVMRLPADLHGIDLLFLNIQEAAALAGIETAAACDGADADRRAQALAAALLARGADAIVLTQGSTGLITADSHGIARLPALRGRPVDVTGAGDALIAGTLSRLLGGAALRDACAIGMLAAILTIESEESVCPAMSPQWIEQNMHRLKSHPPRTRSAS